MDRYSTTVAIKNLDAMGYDADPSSSTPCYKQAPIFHGLVPELKLAYTIYYDTASRGTIDFGSEISAFRGFHRTATFETGDINYYVIVSPTIKENLAHLSRIIGVPAMPPAFAVTGYNASSMMYADTPPEDPSITKALSKFLDSCSEHTLKPTGIYLSSGYTSLPHPTGPVRCVFQYNKERVPSPDDLFSSFPDTPLICNVKPWLLRHHPEYDHVSKIGGLIPRDEPMWSGGPNTSLPGRFVDFLSRSGYDWWVSRCRSALVGRGCRGIWVDNNEYELSDPAAPCGEGKIPVAIVRTAQTLLMAQASYEALKEAPRRPCVVTRGGGPGINRVACLTWTGDNYTSWASLQWNISQHHSLSLSGFAGVSSDVGGFAGPAPDGELLVRWCQSLAFSPRFTIHSWNDDLSVTEPWTHPEHVGAIRGLLEERFRIAPYIYALFASARWGPDGAGLGAPVSRPLHLEFPLDENTHADGRLDTSDPHLSNIASCDYMVGPSILVCPVYKKGVTGRSCYLPRRNDSSGSPTRWYCRNNGRWYDADGQASVYVRCALDSGAPIHFVLGGSIVQLEGEALVARDADGKAEALFYWDNETEGGATPWRKWARVRYDEALGGLSSEVVPGPWGAEGPGADVGRVVVV